MSSPEAIRDAITTRVYTEAAAIADETVVRRRRPIIDWDQKIDDIVTSRIWGFPIMLGLLGVVFWLTIAGANAPGVWIAAILFKIEDYLTLAFQWAGAPAWLHGLLVLGIYRGSAWVIAVMLPPMAIFFPIFTLLEDFGYLPRVAFNLDRMFRVAGAHGKQSLTMGMGFGCNAAAIVSTRIIESPRERLIAILTNSFVPCNGRFPTLITMASIFMGGGVAAAYGSLAASATVVGIVLIGIGTTLAVSWTLSKTLLRGVPSRFSLELPPYRKPQPGRILIRSIYDRTIVVLNRAVTTAAPAGAITWILANIHVGSASLLAHGAHSLDGFGHAIGLDGMILMAFLLGLPANEIVLPILIMGYVSGGAMMELHGLGALKTLLVDQNGWTWLTALNMMLFSLLHYPCGTTLITIHKETKSLKWTVFAGLMPLAIAIAVTFVVTQVVRALGLV
ncbi:MAG TPA: nucleoside recognition domain-containing protein [Symbiobacteriaceae bacterium]|jgi:ferrous iron transport protein B